MPRLSCFAAVAALACLAALQATSGAGHGADWSCALFSFAVSAFHEPLR